uniref:kelch-like protein 21 n=1 Tax=Ciona intestinalis TaxID=7719 RepID=UPI00089DB40D|nr:kelch-like protein 21 [Ciona intestinalis]|eukprot:XP_002128060.2 kelch-like protein 21 [Ciona intestinalis]
MDLYEHNQLSECLKYIASPSKSVCMMLDIKTTTAHSSTFVKPNFSNEIVQGLRNLRTDGKFFDIVIHVADERFPCHRIILAAASNYFRSMFAGMMKESCTDKVTLFGVEPEAAEILIEFCYTGTAVITENNVIELLKASDLLQFHSVREACCEFVGKRLDSSNCLSVRQFAEKLSCAKLADEALTYTAENIVTVACSQEFNSLNYQQIRPILAHHMLNIDKEEGAFEILMQWLKCDIELRKDDFCRLMEVIRLPFIRRIYLLSKIETNPIVRASTLCKKLIKETRLFHTCMLDKNEKTSIRLQPRPSTGIAELLVTVGGCDENCDEATTVVSYNPVSGTWKALAQVEDNLRGGYATVSIGNDIYVTGGSDGATVYNRVWRYKSQVNEWIKVCNMNYAHEYHGSVVLQSYIYVIGSEGCEKYDFISDSWTLIAKVPHRVNNCSVAACAGKIYTIGSLYGSEEILLQVYSPDRDKWDNIPINLPPMSFVPTISSLKGLLYFTSEDSKEVLTFDPRRNEWINTTSPMLHVHLGGSTTVFGGKLIVSGGYDERYDLSGIIEAYDTDTNTWSVIGKMPQPIFWHGCVSIYRYVAAPSGQTYCADPDLYKLSTYVDISQL